MTRPRRHHVPSQAVAPFDPVSRRCAETTDQPAPRPAVLGYGPPFTSITSSVAGTTMSTTPPTSTNS